MARRYALVPESWLGTLNKESVHENVEENKSLPDTNKNVQENKPFVNFHKEVEEKKLVHLAELLPKNMRSRARIVLHYLESGNVTVNDLQRIVYQNGSVGSHIIDLTRYAVSPFMKTRPIDWPQFSALLQNMGVPSSSLANKGEETLTKRNTILDQWKTY